MRLPGSKLSLTRLIIWSIVLAAISFAILLGIGFPLGWSDLTAHWPIVVFLMLPYVITVGLLMRRAWIESRVFSPLRRILLAVPVALVVVIFTMLNFVPVKSPAHGLQDGSSFATADALVPQTGWGWPASYIRVFDEPLEYYGKWQYYDFDTSVNILFVCTLLVVTVGSEAAIVGIWRKVKRRWSAAKGRSVRPGLILP